MSYWKVQEREASENMMPSESSQSQKITNMFLFICNVQNKQTYTGRKIVAAGDWQG